MITLAIIWAIGYITTLLFGLKFYGPSSEWYWWAGGFILTFWPIMLIYGLIDLYLNYKYNKEKKDEDDSTSA